jgi:estrone sulfotransferase
MGRWHFDDLSVEDTYFISFPRSGNTWLRCMLTAVRHGTVTPALVTDTVPDIHRSDPAARPGTGPIWVKSHLPPSRQPFPARVVYLVRHGLDAMVSYHLYLQRRHRVDSDVSFDDWIARNDVWPCPWPYHVDGWLDALEQVASDRTLIVRYEDLVSRPVDHLAVVCRFLGLDAGPDVLEEAVRATSRETLSDMEAKQGSGSLNYVGSAPSSNGGRGRGSAAFLAEAAPVLIRAGYSVT